MTTRGLCHHQGGHAVVPATGKFAFLHRSNWPHSANIHATFKELMPIDSDTIIATMRSAGRTIAASPGTVR